MTLPRLVPQIAEKLHLPQVTYVTEIKKDGNSLTVKRQLEDGYMDAEGFRLPAC